MSHAEQPPEVSGQAFTFSGTATRSGSARIYEGRVTFLDDRWYIMEMDQKPCDTRPSRYSPVADEVMVRCREKNVLLTLSLVEGQIVGVVAGPVPSERTRRVCDQYASTGGIRRCTKWGEIVEEIMVQGTGRAVVTRVSNQSAGWGSFFRRISSS